MMHQTSVNSQAIFDYIFGLTIPGVKLELSRVKTFLERIGNPFTSYPIIHIAGTNGKGSTAAMLAAILEAYDLKVGLFTSPHLISANERVRVNGKMIPDQFVIEKVSAWKPLIEDLGITFFEVLTALGMTYFQDQHVDIAVIETGLGGRLDATNVVDPVLSIITAISMDHENILGSTIKEIAGEKAGIIKTDRPILLGKNSDEVYDVIQDKSLEMQAPFIYVPDSITIENLLIDSKFQRLNVHFGDKAIEVILPLLGWHQAENFSNVLVALYHLNLELDVVKIQKGLDALQWLGRLQTLQADPLVLYDVAHNSAGLSRLLESLVAAGLGDSVLIAAFNARKKLSPLLKILQSWKGPLLYTVFEGHSAVSQNELIKNGVDSELIMASPDQAYSAALRKQVSADQAICFFGSHYLAESLFHLFQVGDHA